jgi:hypothetical protein
MLIIHGIYKFKPKTVAYRNDFCLTCACPRRAYQEKTFDVLHIYFVPLLPVGFWKRWKCEVCKKDPHAHLGTRKSFKWVGVVLLAAFSGAAWFEPVAADYWLWSLRIGLPVACAAALWNTLRSKPDLRLKERLKEIQPAGESLCAVCEHPLILGAHWRCSGCGIERKVLEV